MSSNHFADRLLSACRAKAPVCVGLDPVYERLPATLRQGDPRTMRDAKVIVEAIHTYCSGVIQAVAPHAAAVKLQSACFERYLWLGVEVYHKLVAEARDLGLLVVGDAKRGDIGISAAHYAAGNLADTSFDDLGDLPGPDSLTINAYFGHDGIEPFIATAKSQGKGLFALVRTSNPGGDAVQSLALADGRKVAHAVAEMIAQLGRASGCVGDSGYSLLGAVVGATKVEDAAKLRELMPEQIFLVPGFGAQGAGADDVRACFHKDGRGALITASRSVIFDY